MQMNLHVKHLFLSYGLVVASHEGLARKLT